MALTRADLFPVRPPPPGRRLDVDGLGWHLEEDRAAAPGPPLVLLHGYLAASHVWGPLREALDGLAPWRVIAVDLPGCGHSDRPADAPYDLPWLRDRVRALLDALGVARAVVVGHSLGGALALHLAAAAPGRVAGLALLAPLCFATPLPRILAPAARRPGLFKLFFRSLGRPLIVPAMLRNFHGTRPEQARDLARLGLAHLDATGGWDAATRLGVAAAFRDDMTPLLGGIAAPTLVVHGDRDRVHPPALGQRLAASLPRARALVVEGCGHNPHLEQPAWLAAQLADFVRPLCPPLS